MATTDCWAEWIRTRRTGGDRQYEQRMVGELAAIRDRVLDRVDMQPGETLLDVGCGNGLIGFGALERGAHVVFSDISDDLLGDCRELAEAARSLDRCRFVNASADDLQELDSESIDVVTTRSVLIYVKEKARVFAEFHRVLRPGGRISLFEPINRFGMEQRRCTWGYELDRGAELMEKVNGVYAGIQPESDPMLDFDERDLFALADRAGFFPIKLDYRAEAEPIKPRSWQSFLHSSGNPKIPTLAEAMAEALTRQERDELIAALRPAVEEGRGVWRMGSAYLSGVKPA